MKKIIYITALLVLISSCKKAVLDNIAFPYEKTETYQFEDYETDIVISESYTIPEDKITLIPINSVDAVTGETFEIFAVYIGDIATIATDSIILYAHGQSANMDVYWDRAKLLANITSKNKYGVLMMDYRGYGMSKGEPSEQGLHEDVAACINWLDEKGAKQQNTFFYGFSLGCIPVIQNAAYKTDFVPAKIILEAPLASVAVLAQSSTLINIDPKFISTLEFNNAEHIKNVTMPLLWIHGIEDDYIEISNGQLIFDNHQGESKEAQKIPGAGHSNIPETIGYDKYLKILESFLEK